MFEMIKSVNTTEVAEPFKPLIKLDLQAHADDLGGDGGADDAGSLDDNLETDTELDTDLDDSGDDEGENGQGDADLDTLPAQDDKTNAAFAQMRREKEAYEAQIQQMDALISQQYGDSHGIHTFDEYQEALKEQQQEAERQQYRDAGLPDELIDKLSRVDEVLQQAEQEKFNRLLTDNYDELQKEYPDLVKNPEDIAPEVWQKWNDGESGLTLTEAYELVNKKAIREQLQAASKQSTLNKVNSKSHLRGNGGEGDGDIDLTSIPSDTLQVYRQMFSKELRTGKMKESDFVKHYKKSQR